MLGQHSLSLSLANHVSITEVGKLGDQDVKRGSGLLGSKNYVIASYSTLPFRTPQPLQNTFRPNNESAKPSAWRITAPHSAPVHNMVLSKVRQYQYAGTQVGYTLHCSCINLWWCPSKQGGLKHPPDKEQSLP